MSRAISEERPLLKEEDTCAIQPRSHIGPSVRAQRAQGYPKLIHHAPKAHHKPIGYRDARGRSGHQTSVPACCVVLAAWLTNINVVSEATKMFMRVSEQVLWRSLMNEVRSGKANTKQEGISLTLPS